MTPNVITKVQYYPYIEDGKANSPNMLSLYNKRQYYSSNGNNHKDYLDYVSNGSSLNEVSDYLAYAGNVEKSEGSFNFNGLLQPKDKKEIRDKLRNTKSVIWDMLISFEAEYGKNRVKSYKDALDILKKNLPKFWKANGLDPDNMEFFAGLHIQTLHNHIHISFWEKEPKRYSKMDSSLHYHSGRITKQSLADLRINVEIQMNSNKYFLESFRNNLPLQGKHELEDLDNKVDKKSRYIKKKLMELTSRLPQGRLSYQSLNMVDLRPLIDEISALLISNDSVLDKEYQELKETLFRKDNEIREICERQHKSPERYLYTDKFMKDLKRRLGNIVIDYAKDYKWEEITAQMNQLEKQTLRYQQKQKRQMLVKKTLILAERAHKEGEDLFSEYRRKIQEEEYKRLEEDGGIEAE